MPGAPNNFGGGGKRPKWARTLAERLKPAGYRTYHSGKWHIDGKVLDAGFDRSLRSYDLAPDTCTPVILDGKVYGTAYGEMACLDLDDGLRTIWLEQNDMFYDHTNLIAGNERILLWSSSADLLLIHADKDHSPAGMGQHVPNLAEPGDHDVDSPVGNPATHPAGDPRRTPA